MQLKLRSLVLLALMLAASGLAVALRPTHKLADKRPAINFDATIPHAFGAWHDEPQATAPIVDPRQQQFVNTIYQQTLTRTYVDGAGDRIMLSLAYVENQSDSFGVHLPEVCYPSQGFQVSEASRARIDTARTTIPVRRMVATMGARIEPITYWVTVGDRVTVSTTQRKLVEMRFGLHGEIPDGVLVRVSSIDGDSAHAYETQARFVGDLEATLPNTLQAMLFGEISRP